jgi:hypothetical protein
MQQELRNDFLDSEVGQNLVKTRSNQPTYDYIAYSEIKATPVPTPRKGAKVDPGVPEGASRQFLEYAALAFSVLAGVTALFLAGWLLYQLLYLAWLAVVDAWISLKRWLIDSGAGIGAAIILLVYGLSRLDWSWMTSLRGRPRQRRPDKSNDNRPVIRDDISMSAGGPTIVNNYFFNGTTINNDNDH